MPPVGCCGLCDAPCGLLCLQLSLVLLTVLAACAVLLTEVPFFSLVILTVLAACALCLQKIQRKVLKQYEVADTQGEEVNRDTLNSIATSASPVVEATVLDASYMAKHPEGWAIAAGAADAG